MSYPQPNADRYAVAGYQFFRLNTLLTSPGDIYESTQSGHGLAIGPDSDLANVNVAYFDDQVPTFMQRTTISPHRAFLGRIDARNDVVYTPSNRPGKILFWAADIFDPNYRPIAIPAAFNPAVDIIQFVSPRMDVIEYFKPLASVTPGRDDKTFMFQNYPLSPGGKFYLVLPYYGRKYCSIQFTNRTPLTNHAIAISGVRYQITQDNSANPYTQETQLVASTAVATGAQLVRKVTAAADGMFDALVFSLDLEGPAPLQVTMSDTVE